MQKHRFLIIIPILLFGLTMASCSKDKSNSNTNEEYSQNQAKLSNTTHYIGYIYNGSNDSIRVDSYVNENDDVVLVLFNGVQLENEPKKSRTYYFENDAFAEFDELIEQYPCVELVRSEASENGSLFGKPSVSWVIYYDDLTDEGDCWYNEL